VRESVPGLRERKKQRTREQLVRVSTRLFAERGFENVTVAEIAVAADVSKMTVFNYFPFKEDLVFDVHERMAESLARAVRERAVGRSALRGLREAYLAALAGGGGTVLTGRVSAEFARLVRDSPRLRSREREIGDRGGGGPRRGAGRRDRRPARRPGRPSRRRSARRGSSGARRPDASLGARRRADRGGGPAGRGGRCRCFRSTGAGARRLRGARGVIFGRIPGR